MKKKILISLLVALVITAVVGTQVSARWENTSSLDLTLTFSGNTALCGAKLTGYSGSTITATVTLERKLATGGYATVKVWSGLTGNLSSGSKLLFSDSHTVTKGYTYRLSIDAEVLRDDYAEPISNWVENKLS